MSKVAKKRKPQPTIIPIDSEDKKGLDPKPPQDHPLSMHTLARTLWLNPLAQGLHAACPPGWPASRGLGGQLVVRFRPFRLRFKLRAE